MKPRRARRAAWRRGEVARARAWRAALLVQRTSREPMHIALISTTCVPVPPPRYGGTELIIAELARELVALGHRITLYATGDSTLAVGALRARFPSAVWPPDPHRDLVHAHFAAHDLRRLVPRVDVVHAHTPTALAFADATDAPTVYTVHHDRTENLVELYRYVDQAEYVLISRHQYARNPELLHRHVVHHGLDARSYAPGPGDGGYVAFLGRFSPDKGPHFAIDAARAAGVPIVLAGQAHEDSKEFYECELLPRLAAPGVRAIGEAGHEAKQVLLGGARALLFPIAWDEPFGLVMIEAMLCGTPVVAFRRGSVPEVVEDGVTGFVVDDVGQMADAIARAGRLDRARVRRVAEEQWSSARMARQYLEVYAAGIDRARARARRSGAA